MKIDEIIWKEYFVEKIEKKHHVTTDEVGEVLQGKPQVYRIRKGRLKDEAVYLALGTTNEGRHLTVIFILKSNKHSVLPISARDMDKKERKRYKNG